MQAGRAPSSFRRHVPTVALATQLIRARMLLSTRAAKLPANHTIPRICLLKGDASTFKLPELRLDTCDAGRIVRRAHQIAIRKD